MQLKNIFGNRRSEKSLVEPTENKNILRPKKSSFFLIHFNFKVHRCWRRKWTLQNEEVLQFTLLTKWTFEPKVNGTFHSLKKSFNCLLQESLCLIPDVFQYSEKIYTFILWQTLWDLRYRWRSLQSLSLVDQVRLIQIIF